MMISRRNLFKAGIAAGTALSIPSVLRAQTSPTSGQTVRMAMTDIGVFDPILSTTEMTYDHALAIYDTLFGIDSKLLPQPQMVHKWDVADDRKTYTFELRDGLRFHDGSPVTAADCVASIRRWGVADSGGQLIMARARDISKKDDKTFTIKLKEPMGLLIDILASPSGLFPAIMREKDADRPATEQVTSNIGSGPFKFNEALAKPGASFVYDRNEQYLPRKEHADGFAGGKSVKVDRAIWQVITDQQTAIAALQAGEIDYFAWPPADLYPVIDSDPNLELQVQNRAGKVYYLRLNFLQPPFDNVKARQAMLHLIDQEAFLSIIAPDSRYAHPVTSIFGNSTPYSNDENTGWFKQGGDPEKAKQLFQEAGYAGEKVVILQPTDWPTGSNASQLLGAALRKIGFNVELAPMSFAELAVRRANKGSIENGGWSMFISNDSDLNFGDPISNATLRADGDGAFYGWPKNDEYEALRAKWADVESLEERKTLARKMQRVWWDFVGALMLGQVVSPIARRKALTGLIQLPVGYIPMWNMQKA
ncbi:ABC transporter substrate-binding protein [Mesorhizobium sp.]|uniref:ABC transporter substrate-binding protein n=1 Tax=Mesorhizobium sp. TaxID=1871066 RepID=UPI001222A91E|nr:ABC transporter substrate-binding protein [Mesorhizobium sp.]TIP43759.1 MAG: ABC transporter substrate-binding protein [Mesorhizobium sp.]